METMFCFFLFFATVLTGRDELFSSPCSKFIQHDVCAYIVPNVTFTALKVKSSMGFLPDRIMYLTQLLLVFIFNILLTSVVAAHTQVLHVCQIWYEE